MTIDADINTNNDADNDDIRSRIARSLAVIEAGMSSGLHVGAQLYVSIEGRVVADLAVGIARPQTPMTPQTLMLWFSSGKPLAAVAIAQLWEAGKLRLDDRVAEHIPQFAEGGKEAITIRHLLTHTGGFRAGRRSPSGSWQEIVAGICAAKIEPNWIPGRKAGYHASTSWIILGEMVRRLDGRPFEQYVRDALFMPLGMNDSWVGMPPQAYRAYGQRIGLMHNTTTSPPTADFEADTEAGATVCRPGGNARGPIRELGRFYEMLQNHGELNGARVLLPQTVEAMAARHRVRMMDQTFRRIMDWGLGFIVNSKHGEEADVPYGFGPYASPRTFGHGGFQSSQGMCDPERKLVIAFVFNGACGEEKHHERRGALLAALYEDMGLTTW